MILYSFPVARGQWEVPLASITIAGSKSVPCVNFNINFLVKNNILLIEWGRVKACQVFTSVSGLQTIFFTSCPSKIGQQDRKLIEILATGTRMAL